MHAWTTTVQKRSRTLSKALRVQQGSTHHPSSRQGLLEERKHKPELQSISGMSETQAAALPWLEPVSTVSPQACQSLFPVSRASRDVVLHASSIVKLRVSLPSTSKPVPPTVVQCLRTRGRAPTQLSVTAPDTLSDSDRHRGTVQLCQQLQTVGRVVSSLHFAPPITHPDLPALLASTFPALTQLHLTTLATPLPHPSALPQLTDLGIEGVAGQAVMDSIAQLLPQLTHLHTGNWAGWPSLLSAASAPSALTHLSTLLPLTDELLGLLVTQAPCLDYLSAGAFSVETDGQRGKAWGVKTLLLQSASADLLQCVAELPTVEQGRTKIACRDWAWQLYVPTLQGFTQPQMDLLAHWEPIQHPQQRDPQDPTVTPASTLRAGDQPAALLAALQQLGTLPASDGVCWLLQGWSWKFMLTAAVSAALSDMPHLNVGVGGVRVTDELWGCWLSLGSKLRRVWVPENLTLTSYGNALKPWPWESVTADEMHWQTLLVLPMPDAQNSRRVVRAAIHMDLTYKEVAGGSPAACMNGCACSRVRVPQEHSGISRLLAQRMCGMHLAAPIQGGQATPVVLPCPPYTSYTEQPVVLRRQLGALHGVARDRMEHPLVIQGYELRWDILEELKNLPAWETVLQFKNCTWEGKYLDHYLSMADRIPSSYFAWAVDSKASELHVMCLCASVAKHRPVGLPPLRLHYSGSGAGELGVQVGSSVRLMPALA